MESDSLFEMLGSMYQINDVISHKTRINKKRFSGRSETEVKNVKTARAVFLHKFYNVSTYVNSVT